MYANEVETKEKGKLPESLCGFPVIKRQSLGRGWSKSSRLSRSSCSLVCVSLPIPAQKKNRRKGHLCEYSYFEKGCRQKCTQQSRKVMWVALNSLFLKEISKKGRKRHGRTFASANGKCQKQVRQLQCQEQCIDHIPYYLSRLSRAHFFPTTILEIAVFALSAFGSVKNKRCRHFQRNELLLFTVKKITLPGDL